MREIDNLAVRAKDDIKIQEELIRQNEYYILKCASKVCHRYISRSDDEWSVSLHAFCQAMKSYDLGKGSFLKFTSLVIKRRLIDYMKNQNKYHTEILVDPVLFDTPSEEEADDIPIRMEVAEKIVIQNTDDIKLEIEAVNKAFSGYGFTFFDLSECSPHSEKTRKACARAVNYMLENPILINEMQSTGQLSLKNIEKFTKVPRKTLERHRKYIIAAVEILYGEYPKIAEYLRYIKLESQKQL